MSPVDAIFHRRKKALPLKQHVVLALAILMNQASECEQEGGGDGSNGARRQTLSGGQDCRCRRCSPGGRHITGKGSAFHRTIRKRSDFSGNACFLKSGLSMLS